MEKPKINEDVGNFLRMRMNKLFKSVLGVIEKESRKFEIKEEFFKKGERNKEGFALIRKVLFDQGNDIIETLEFLLKQLKLQSANLVLFTPEVMEQMKGKETK